MEKTNPMAGKFTKMFFNIARQTKPPANTDFSPIPHPRMGRFQPDFFGKNHVFRAVILSTIKDANLVNNIWKMLSMNDKSRLKSPKLRKN